MKLRVQPKVLPAKAAHRTALSQEVISRYLKCILCLDYSVLMQDEAAEAQQEAHNTAGPEFKRWELGVG